jgi:hypothetical protein
MTGAPVPAGADAMVMVEDTERIDGGRRGCSYGAACRPATRSAAAGDDVHAGERCWSSGDGGHRHAVAGVLASVELRSLAGRASGHGWRCCRRATNWSTTLARRSAPARSGESNKTMLLGMIAGAGAEAVDHRRGARRRGGARGRPCAEAASERRRHRHRAAA